MKRTSMIIAASVLAAGILGAMNVYAEAEKTEDANVFAEAEKSEGVMTYEEYVAAELDSEVTVETYVQAKQGWWEDEGQGQASIYTQDEDGAYFINNLPFTQEEFDAMVEGSKIKVTGFKSEWSGEGEIVDAVFEMEEGSYIAEPVDVTEFLGKDEIIDYMNQKVCFKGLTVEPAAEGSDSAFLYNWDGSGEEGNDLYFNVSLDGTTYSFTVESYLCGADTDVYKAVKELKIGDVIDLEGYLYWYNGINPHITAVAAAQAE